MKNEFREDLEQLILLHGVNDASGTPEYILAEFLIQCLDNFTKTMELRDSWVFEEKERP